VATNDLKRGRLKPGQTAKVSRQRPPIFDMGGKDRAATRPGRTVACERTIDQRWKSSTQLRVPQTGIFVTTTVNVCSFSAGSGAAIIGTCSTTGGIASGGESTGGTGVSMWPTGSILSFSPIKFWQADKAAMAINDTIIFLSNFQ